MVFAADRRYLPGDEVCTTYGDMDNAKRLFSFGFVTLVCPSREPAPSADEILLPTEAFCDVTFPIHPGDSLVIFKRGVFQELGQICNGGVPTLGAVFPLTSCLPLVSQLVEGPAQSFVESAMPLLRLASLTLEELKS